MVITPIWCQHMEKYVCFVHINNDMKLQLFREQSFTPDLTQYYDMCILVCVHVCARGAKCFFCYWILALKLKNNVLNAD